MWFCELSHVMVYGAMVLVVALSFVYRTYSLAIGFFLVESDTRRAE